ncbi:MAG: hypothetical protein HY431_02645 [Candidatus Levybacteria bacterium]|nr:hypothetical protein [Candidatus Levybacteria bacterium]
MARPQGVLYVDKYFFDIYSDLLGTVLRFPFAPQVVRDYDIVDKDGFLSQLRFFIQQNKIQPLALTIILSAQVLFAKQIALADPTKREAAGLSFVESVPFEFVGSVSIPSQNGVEILASNKDMYQTLKQGFATDGFSTDGVFPAILLRDIHVTNGLTADIARRILSMSVSLRAYNFLALPQTVSPEVKTEEGSIQSQSKKSNRLYVMIGVFVLLILVLAVFIFLTNRG